MTSKRKAGGFVPTNQDSTGGGLAGRKSHSWGKGQSASGTSTSPRLPTDEKYRNEGRGYKRGGSVKAGAGSGISRLQRSK